MPRGKKRSGDSPHARTPVRLDRGCRQLPQLKWSGARVANDVCVPGGGGLHLGGAMDFPSMRRLSTNATAHEAKPCRRSCSEGSVRGRVHVGLKAVSNPRGGGLHRVARKVSVTDGRLDLTVAEELPDHRQAFTEREGPRDKAVGEVMNSHVLEPGLCTHPEPGCVQIGQTNAPIRQTQRSGQTSGKRSSGTTWNGTDMMSIPNQSLFSVLAVDRQGDFNSRRRRCRQLDRWDIACWFSDQVAPALSAILHNPRVRACTHKSGKKGLTWNKISCPSRCHVCGLAATHMSRHPSSSQVTHGRILDPRSKRSVPDPARCGHYNDILWRER